MDLFCSRSEILFLFNCFVQNGMEAGVKGYSLRLGRGVSLNEGIKVRSWKVWKFWTNLETIFHAKVEVPNDDLRNGMR